MAVSKRLRYEVLRRDNHACRYCGAAAPDVRLTVDHVIPVALGGGDTPDNLVTACGPCNGGKSSSSPDAPLVANVAEDALRWRKAMEVARGMAVAEHEQMRIWHDLFYDCWHEFTFIIPKYKGGTNEPEHFPLPIDWRSTITDLAADGMLAHECRAAIDIAMSRQTDDKFRYFVGIVRNKIRERMDIARTLIDNGTV